MFSFGQMIFGFVFFIAFVVIIYFSYKNDKKNNPIYFQGSYKILFGFIIAFGFLVLIKFLTQK